MAIVGLKMLKNGLSEYIRLVQAGETVTVTDRGRVVAEIVPPRAEPSSPEGDRELREHNAPAWLGRQASPHSPIDVEGWEQRGVREGWLTPALIRDGSPPPRMPVKGLTLEQLLQDLERDREDR